MVWYGVGEGNAVFQKKVIVLVNLEEPGGRRMTPVIQWSAAFVSQ